VTICYFRFTVGSGFLPRSCSCTSSLLCLSRSIHLGNLQRKIKLSRYRHAGAKGERTIWGWVANITPRSRFTPGERNLGTHWLGGWVGHRAGLDTKARGKNPLPLPGIHPSNTSRPVCSHTLYWLILCWTSMWQLPLCSLEHFSLQRTVHVVAHSSLITISLRVTFIQSF
jgi:hypothetical protein